MSICETCRCDIGTAYYFRHFVQLAVSPVLAVTRKPLYCEDCGCECGFAFVSTIADGLAVGKNARCTLRSARDMFSEEGDGWYD